MLKTFNYKFFLDEIVDVDVDSEEVLIVRKFIASPAPKRGQIFWEVNLESNPNPVSDFNNDLQIVKHFRNWVFSWGQSSNSSQSF